jgi:hypothetical protein
LSSTTRSPAPARRPLLAALAVASASAVLLLDRAALAATLSVGAGQPFATIQDALPLAVAGDVIEVQGDATYPGDLWFRPENGGDPGNPITVRGIAVNGRRPIIQGVGTEEYHDIIVFFHANHFVFEGFEIVGDGDPEHFGLVTKADDVTIRDCVVHGVGSHGILATDDESGSVLLESCELYANGEGTYNHQIYMASDESMYPGSVFRMQYCYVHDATGGNSVKSRAERNEIYFNWIEGGVFHELDLIGPDGQDEGLAREDSDVVGNVLVKHSEWRIARIGGDGTGNTSGRYRFVNNTMVLGEASDTAITMQETVGALEMHNNVVVRIGGEGGTLVNETDTFGPPPTVTGSNNWVQDGFDVRAEIGATFGTDAGFTDASQYDFRPRAGSPLVNAGAAAATAVDFPSPLLAIAAVPPSRLLGTHGNRPADDALDLGAYEFGTGNEPGEPATATVAVSSGNGTGATSGGNGSGSGSPQGAGGADASAGPGGDGDGDGDGPSGDGSGSAGDGGGDAAEGGGADDGCSCRAVGGANRSTSLAISALAGAAVAVARRRARGASIRR